MHRVSRVSVRVPIYPYCKHSLHYGPAARAPDTYGELGIRHEDTVIVTENGCENLSPKWSGTPEEPAVV